MVLATLTFFFRVCTWHIIQFFSQYSQSLSQTSKAYVSKMTDTLQNAYHSASMAQPQSQNHIIKQRVNKTDERTFNHFYMPSHWQRTRAPGNLFGVPSHSNFSMRVKNDRRKEHRIETQSKVHGRSSSIFFFIEHLYHILLLLFILFACLFFFDILLFYFASLLLSSSCTNQFECVGCVSTLYTRVVCGVRKLYSQCLLTCVQFDLMIQVWSEKGN